MIRYVIESHGPRLRFPVGPDALSFLGWRGALSDEDWVGLSGLVRDADYFERVLLDTGVDPAGNMFGKRLQRNRRRRFASPRPLR